MMKALWLCFAEPMSFLAAREEAQGPSPEGVEPSRL